MAINSNNEVNLIDIITTENGITKLPKNYKINGSFYFLDYKNVYDKNTLSDFKYNKLPKINIFEKDIKKFYKSRKGSIIATWSSETNYDIFQSIYIDTSKPFVVNGFCKIINVIDINLINPKWLTFYLNFNPIIQKQRSSIPYTTRCNMTLNELKNIKIKIIPIENQQQIINIIEPKEDLFLKYHKVVDITTLETFTSSWANLINIIEPFEKIECKYKAKIDYILKIGDFKILNPFSTKYFLRDFFNVEIGQTPSTKNKSYWKDGENFWINSGALTNNLVLLNATNKITQNAVKSKNLKKSNKYSTFISIMEPSINKISLSGISSYFNQSIANIEPINKNDYGFIFFELRRNIYKLSSLSTGTAQKSINKSDLLNFKINRPIDDNLLFFKLSKLLINHHNIIFHCKKIINLITSLLII